MRRSCGQSLIELALVAPILILLAMSVWDGGSALREQVVLQQAARDGARVAATGYGTAVLDSVVTNAVIASARDLPALSSTPGYVVISYPDARSVQVRVSYAHNLITPVLRQLWAGGTGAIMLQASATFYLPQLTPVPATVVASTPTATMTPLINPCTLSPSTMVIQALGNNTGYWCTLRLSTSSSITATWEVGSDPNNQLLIYTSSPDPFLGRADPISGNYLPGGQISSLTRPGSKVQADSSCVTLGVYSVYFFNRGGNIDAGTATVATHACP